MLKEVTIYEYIIEDKTIKEFEFEAEEAHANFYLVHGRSGQRYINKDDLNKIYNNRIITFENDLDKYKRMLIEYQEEKVIKYKKQYEQQLDVLEELIKLL